MLDCCPEIECHFPRSILCVCCTRVSTMDTDVFQISTLRAEAAADAESRIAELRYLREQTERIAEAFEASREAEKVLSTSLVLGCGAC